MGGLHAPLFASVLQATRLARFYAGNLLGARDAGPRGILTEKERCEHSASVSLEPGKRGDSKGFV